MPEQKHQWPETLKTFHDNFHDFFLKKGISENDSTKWAYESTLELSNLFGGIQIYIPRGDSVTRELRNISITRRLGKETARDLAAEYKLSSKQIWEISRNQRAANRLPLWWR